MHTLMETGSSIQARLLMRKIGKSPLMDFERNVGKSPLMDGRSKEKGKFQFMDGQTKMKKLRLMDF